jgi:O-antigen chain-terminating methyltransferase
MSDDFINVDELMSKIREEVARRDSGGRTTSPPNHADAGHPTFSSNWPHLTGILSQAEQNANVGTKNMPMLKFARPYRWIARLVGRIVLYLGEVITNPQRKFNHSVLDALRATVDFIGQLEQAAAKQDNRIAGLEQSLKERDNRISGLEASLNQGLSDQDNRIAELEQSLKERDNRISGLEASLNQGLSDQDNRIAGLEQSLKERDNRISGLEASLNQGLSDQDNRIAELKKNIAYLKNSLILQERRVAMLLEEARKRLPEPFNKKQLQTIADEELHFLDSLYVSFEDQFRGTREDIKDRLKVYPPLIREAKAGTERWPILDVGCGRGEWLELVREEGLKAQGVEINRVLVRECREHGLQVIEGEIITYLQTLPDASLGAVTGFHIIEHLSFDALLHLLDETVRVLKPGGMAIFETPNPENVLVGSCNFYLDPTHNKPLPSSMMKFIVEARGFCRVEILNLHPYPETFKLSGSGLADRFNKYFYGPQDYSVVAYKI